MDDKDFDLAICSRIGPDLPKPVTQGVEAICSECDHKIWLSHTTKTAFKDRNPVLVCMVCGIPKVNLGKLVFPTPEQMAEILNHLKNDK